MKGGGMKPNKPKMTREIAEAHWHFIENLLRMDNEDGLVSIEMAGLLYIEAMLHGAKHERKD